MDLFSPFHLIILLVIIVLLFGTSKLKKMGPDLGSAVRGFKKAMRGDDEDEKQPASATSERLQADPAPAASATHQEQRDSTESK